jgi:predicted permease
MIVRVLVAGIAGAIVMFILGWVIYGMLLASYFGSTMSATAKSVMRMDNPNFVPLIISEIAFGILFAFIFEKWGARTFVAGLGGGAILMVLIGFGFDMQMDAFFKDMHVGSPYVPMVVDLVCGAVMGAISGGVIAAVLGMMNKGDAAAAG